MRPEQVRAARGLLDWSQEELATRAGVRRQVISLYEKKSSIPHDATLEAIYKAFNEAGITFIQMKDGKIGVLIDEF